MPLPYIDKMSKKHKKSKEELEHKWSKAKELAKKSGKENNYGYITGIFKRMIGEDFKFLDFEKMINGK